MYILSVYIHNLASYHLFIFACHFFPLPLLSLMTWYLGVPHSRYVRQLLSSVKSVWEMKLPPEFVSLSVYMCACILSVISLFIHLSTFNYEFLYMCTYKCLSSEK